MCIKWIRANFHSEKKPQNEKICLDDDEKESLLGAQQNIDNLNIEDKAGFKKWYLNQFKEELEEDCFKALLTGAQVS